MDDMFVGWVCDECGDACEEGLSYCDDCADDFRDVWFEDSDGQPDEAQEWHDFDPDC